MQNTLLTLGLIICLQTYTMAQAPSDASRAKLKSIIENVNASNARRYDTKDNLGYSMDCAKIISNPEGGFIAVYHHYVNGTAKVFVAKSTNFLNWTMVKELASQASQPAIAEATDGGYVVAWEQEPSNHLKFSYYASLSNLFEGIASKTYDAARKLSSCAEGTPSIYSASSTFIDAGFHFYKNCDVDRQARGTLTNFNTWTCQAQGEFDNALLYYGLKGNIGDRDACEFEGYKFGVIEGQGVKGDFGSWKSYIYDYQTGNAEPLNIATAKGSTAFANPAITKMTIDGKKSLVITMFIPSEGAKSGEAGELIYYKNIEEITTSLNESNPNVPDITVYPIPAVAQVNIRSDRNQISEVAVYNMLGRLVYISNESFIGKKSFDTGQFSHGIYIIKVKTTSQTDISEKSFLIQVL